MAIFQALVNNFHDDFSPLKAQSLVGEMLHKKLITKQTPKEGIPVNHVMVAESVDILRETYLCILMDR